MLIVELIGNSEPEGHPLNKLVEYDDDEPFTPWISASFSLVYSSSDRNVH